MRPGIALLVLWNSSVIIGAQALPTLKLTEPSRDLTVEGFQAEHFAHPKWERGYLVSYDYDRSIIMAADSSGKVLRAHISPQQTSQVLLRDISVSPRGTFAVAFSAVSSNGGAGGFIAWLDRTGSTAQLVQITSGVPFQVCFADDGSLWAAVRGHRENMEEAAAYDILRHYDASGKLISSTLPRKVFPAGIFPGEKGSLTASHDRIGFFAPAARTWVEVDYAGKSLGQWVLSGPKAAFSWAFLSQSNEVHISQQERIGKSDVLKTYRLDRFSNTLQELDTSGINRGRPASLLGVDGEDLVFLVSYHPRVLKWSTFQRSSATPAN